MFGDLQEEEESRTDPETLARREETNRPQQTEMQFKKLLVQTSQTISKHLKMRQVKENRSICPLHCNYCWNKRLLSNDRPTSA